MRSNCGIESAKQTVTAAAAAFTKKFGAFFVCAILGYWIGLHCHRQGFPNHLFYCLIRQFARVHSVLLNSIRMNRNHWNCICGKVIYRLTFELHIPSSPGFCFCIFECVVQFSMPWSAKPFAVAGSVHKNEHSVAYYTHIFSSLIIVRCEEWTKMNASILIASLFEMAKTQGRQRKEKERTKHGQASLKFHVDCLMREWQAIAFFWPSNSFGFGALPIQI